MTVIPKFEPLEDRIVLDGADPDVTIVRNNEEPLELGEQDVEYTLTFDNVGTESGYVPYVDLIIPSAGDDGDDGPTFDSASFLGGDIDTTLVVFDVNGEAEHPFLLDAMGDPLLVTGGDEGDTLVVFELPYGSFSPGNPAVDILFTLDYSQNSELAETPTLQAIGGFALGCDPLDNPDDDAPIRDDVATTLTENYQLFSVDKTNNVPEAEAATGPSYEYQYRLTVDVADGQTLTDFTLTDTLPPEIVYLGNPVISGGTGATITSEPPIGVQVTSPDNQLVVDFAEVTGTVTVTFDYYVSNDPSDSASPTNDPTDGLQTPVVNELTGAGTWNPSDSDDTQGQLVSASDTDIIQATTLAVQKTNAVLTDNNAAGASPGDVYEFTLEVQVSDYFTFGDLILTDVLGDGWVYEAGSAEFSTSEETGSITTVTSFGVDENDTFDAATGETTVIFELSDAMIAAGQDGLLTGDIAADAGSSGSQTTVTITYRAAIADNFVDTGTGSQEVSQGDSLTNAVEIEGTVRDNTNTATVFDTVTNTSAIDVEIPQGEIREKTVFALNGSTALPSDVVIAAGDTVTFSIIYDAPLGAFENFNITDNLPQLVFDSTEVVTFDPAPADNSSPPPAGVAYFGALDTFSANATGVPTITNVASDNQIDFDFGDLTLATRDDVVIHVLFTVTVQDALFAPDLFLTNQATATETNTTGETISSTAIAQFNYAEPDLNITKGVIATDSTDPAVTLTGDTGPVATAPGSTGFRYTSVNSNDLDPDQPGGSPIDGDIENVDAGDIVSFAIVVENTGGAPNGAFNVTLQDTLPDGFEIPSGGLNLNISDGNGTAIPFTATDGASAAVDSDIFGAGIMLTDDAALEGALSVFSETSGENIVIVTYDLVVSGDITPSNSIVNTATIATYSAFEGDGNFDGIDGPVNRADADDTDTAQATATGVDIEKTLVSREFEDEFSGERSVITGNNDEVAIGEDLEFLIRVDVPEGVLFETVISDLVSDGELQLVSATIETIGSGLTNTGGVSVGDTAPITTDTSGRDGWSFDFDTLTAVDDNDLTNDFIEIRVVANVPDSTGEVADDREANLARIDFQNADGDSVVEVDIAVVRVIEPVLTIEKTALPEEVVADGLANYEVTINNVDGARDAPAFDLVLNDTLDPDIILDPTSIEVTLNGTVILDSATQVFTDAEGHVYSITSPANGDSNSLEIFADILDPDDELIISYNGVVVDDVASGKTLENTATLVFDSTPEDNVGDPDGDDREYNLSADADVVTIVPDITKTIVAGSTSYDETDGDELGIGETLTYEFVVFIPEGTINDVVVVDELPEGLEYVSSEVIRIGTGAGTNITGSGLSVGGSATVSGQTVSFNFGDLINTPDSIRDGSDEIVVQITARVADIPENSDTDTLTNTGRLTFTNGDDVAEDVSNSQTITIVEPDMSIDKVVAPTTADAGDVVSYTITATNDGTGPAYDMIISDDIVGPAIAADQSSLGIMLLTDTGGPFTPVEAATFSFNADGELQVIIPDLPAGHQVVITYDAVVQDSALFSTTYTNTAEIERYDSNPIGSATAPSTDPDEDDRVQTGPSDTAAVTTTDAGLTKEFFSSGDTNTIDPIGGDNAQLTVGEVVTYELTITVPQGTAGIVLTDNLPNGLLAQSAQVISVGDDTSDTAGLAAGDTETNADITINAARDSVEFDFGTVVIAGLDDAAGGTTEIVVRVTSIVDDVAAAMDGLSLVNTATLSLTDPDTGAALQPDINASETVDVVAPEIEFEKTGEVAGDIGDTVSYVITAENIGTAPAYDVVIADPLGDANLTYESGTAIVSVNGTALAVQPAITVPAPGETGGFAFVGLTIQAGDTVTVDFDARILGSAPTAETFINTASVNYDTVPGDPVDADGNATDREFSDSDDHAVATSPSITKTPFASNLTETDSEFGDTPFDLAIGESVTFRFEITLPEIAFDNVTASDLLPPGLEFVSASVVDVNGTGSDGTVVATPDGANPNLIALDFGAMTNASDGGIGADDVLVFDVVARVTNDGIPNAGDSLTNTISLIADPTGDDPFAPVEATAVVRVVEPDLTVDKIGPLAISPGASGDFKISVTNVGVSGAEGPAYDIDISDALPTGLELVPSSLVFTDGSGNVIVPTTLSVSTGAFSARFELLDVGETINVAYTAELDDDAAPLTEFVNTASADFFSAPDDLLDGAGNPVAEDYAPVTDTSRFFTGPTLEKEANSSGFAETPDDADGDSTADVTIGETITFDLILTLPEIPMDTVVLNDVLPVGLSFISAEVTAVGSEITVDGDNAVADVNAGASFVNVGQTLTVTFEDVVNAYIDGTIAQAQDAIIVQVTARVEDVAAVLDGGTLTNMADLTVTPLGEDPLTPATADETIEIVNPDLTVDKTSTVAVNPGDDVDYVVTITNDGTSAAYDITFEDTFDNALLTLNAGTVTVDLDGADITSDLTITTSGDGFTFDLIDTATGVSFDMPVGSVLTVEYQATLDASAPEAQTFQNTAEVSFDNLPGDPLDDLGNPIDGRDYTSDDDAAVATVPFVTKTPVASNFIETDSILGSDPFDLAIGEEVSYTYELYLPEIDMSNVVFTDDLPPGLEFISLTIDSYGAGLTDLAGNAIVDPATVFDPSDDSMFSLDFGGIRNPEDDPLDPTIGPDDIITITVVARVTDEQSAGDTLTNTTTLTVTPDGAPALATATNSADVRVVEPEITQDKTGPFALDPGDTGTFVITTTNSGPDVTPSATGPAYDVSIVDALPTGMTLDETSISITLNGVSYTPGAGELTTSTTGFTLLFDVLEADDVVEITYDAALSATASPVSAFINTVTTEYDSAPGEVLDSDGNPIEQTYDPVVSTHATASQPTLEKDSISSGFTETAEDADTDDIRDLAIGETTTYELVLTLPEIPMDVVTLTDMLPDGLIFVSAELTEIGSAITVDGGADLMVINANTTVTETGQLLTLRLDDVLNSDADGMGTRGVDTLVFQVVARVDAIATNNGTDNGIGTQLTNTAGLVVTPEGEAALDEVVATETVEIVEPDLELVKAGDITGDRGSETEYTITVTNNGNGSAHDAIVTDTLSDPFLTLGSGAITVTLDGIAISPTIATPVSGETDGFSISGLTLQPGEVLVITVPVLIEANTPDAVTLINTAEVVYDGTPGDPVDTDGNLVADRDYSDSDTHAIATSPGLDKTPFTSNISETESEAGDTPFELAIGETVTYRYTLTLPEIDMDSVVVSDLLPEGLEFVGVNVISVNGTGASGSVVATPDASNPNLIAFDFGAANNVSDGSIGADDLLVFDVTALVLNDGTSNAGETKTNTATLTVDPVGAVAFGSIEATADVSIVEPDLTIDKTGPFAIDPGAFGDYTITLNNEGLNGAPGPAFDVDVTDALPTSLILDETSIVVTLNGAAFTPTTVTTSPSGFTLEFDLIPAEGEVVIEYRAQLDPNVAAITGHENVATAVFSSAPNALLDANGDPAGTVYPSITDNHNLSTIPTLEKTAISTGYSETEEDGDNDGVLDLVVGETVTYELVLTLPEVPMDVVTLTDKLPEGLTFVSAEITFVGSEITLNGATNITSSNNLITVEFLDVFNLFVDNTIDASEDSITVEITSRVTDVAAVQDGAQLVNEAGLIVRPQGGPDLIEITDTATVEIVEPDIGIVKTTDAIEPFLGDIITYTVVVTNDGNASSPAFNSVVTDTLPAGLELAGLPELSDATLGSASPLTTVGGDTLLITIPMLQPGESLTITYEAFVGFTTNVLEPLLNTADVSTSSSPDLDDGFGRTYTENDDVAIFPNPVPELPDDQQNHAINGIDDAQFLPVLLIDPIFTGTAVPGANVTINLYRSDGSLDYVRNIVSDAGGNWIAIFPRTELGPVQDDFHEAQTNSVLFDAPVRLLDQTRFDNSGLEQSVRTNVVGADLGDQAYTLGINVDRPSSLPDQSAQNNTRIFFAPSHIGEIYGRGDSLDVGEVFDNVAFRTVQDLYNASSDPLGVSLNRFNYEFLGDATAVPGAQ
ncbi:MAG: isopeptide-forming domain-containing fimbrial protein [Litoreibacter sp.]